MYNALTSRLPNQISSERANLLVQIAKCHRLAKEVDDQETVNKLLPLAAEYEQKLNHQPGPQATTNPASNSLGADANKVEGIPALVRHLQRPLVARLELTINVLEQFAGNSSPTISESEPWWWMLKKYLAIQEKDGRSNNVP
jgi:hypothetical protein